MISIIIPVYKESKFLVKILNKLLNEKVKKEIIVVIDEPTKSSLKIAKKFKRKVKFLINGKRIGKVEALNKAVKIAKGNIFLFLDSDIEIPSRNFLKKILNKMDEYDLLDIKKVTIQNSFFAKLSYFEYISYNFVNLLISRYAKKSFGINGAAFAIRKKAFEKIKNFSKVISEDADFGTKSLKNNLRFGFANDIYVKVSAPSKLNQFIEQRKRWGVGIGEWIKKDWRILKKGVKKYPFVLISLPIFFPTFFFILASYFLLKNFLLPKASYWILLPFLYRFNFILPISYIFFITPFFQSIIFTLGFFALYSIFFFIISKILKVKFNLFWFFLYLFFYQPFTFTLMLGGIFAYLIKKDVKLDWKV